jgi:hypothetical protein
MNKQQSAVEWLVEQLKTKYDIDIERLSVTDKAKAINEQHIMDAFDKGTEPYGYNNGEEYYNETFKKD